MLPQRFTPLFILTLVLAHGVASAQPARSAPVSPRSDSKEVNVVDFGAKGDGLADDTEAFQKAIARSPQAGSIRVPPGRYRLTDTLNLNAVTLLGADAGAWGADKTGLPTLLPEGMDGPCIRLGPGGSVHGLHIFYDWQGKEPSPGPPAIELTAVGTRISDMKIHGAWDGISANGKSNVGRSLIQNCFIVDVHNVGVRILGTWDVSWISKVEIWSPGSKRFPQEGIGFLIGKNDMLLMSDCFVFTAQTAYKFVETIPGCDIKGVFWGSLTNCSADFSGTGIDIEGAHTVSLAGGTYWTHWTGLVLKGQGGQVRMSGLEMKSNGGPTVDVRGGLAMAVSGCQFRREMKKFTAPALRISGGESVAVTGCVLRCTSKAVEIDPKVEGAVVTGNVVRDYVREEAAANAEK
jgi:hypothetical protein